MNAFQQRKQRQERVRREKSAIILQSTIRSHLSRLRTIQQCSVIILSTESSPTSLTSSLSLSIRLAALSVCLSYQSTLAKFNTNRTNLLLGFQIYLFNNYNNNHDKEKNHADHNQPCTEIDTNSPQPMDYSDDSFSASWFALKRIIKHTLVELDPNRNSTEINDKLFWLLNNYREYTRIDDTFFLDLARCMQKWCRFVDANQSLKSAEEYTVFLTNWAIDVEKRLDNPNAKALLAAILLGSDSYNFNSNDCKNQSEEWFTSLAELLQVMESDGIDSLNSMDLILQATKEILCSTHVQRLLSNLLNLTNNTRLMLLINHTLSQPQYTKLKLAVSLIARGDSLTGVHVRHDASLQNCSRTNDWDKDEFVDVEEDELDRNPSSNKKARGGSTQYKRHEISTLVKLDKLYNERIQQSIKEHHFFDPTTIDIAEKIVKAPWKEWGFDVLSTKKKTFGLDDKRESERYVVCLGILLQTSSSMRPKTRFTPLSPVAFNQSILMGLWNIAKEDKVGVALSVFADLFSHYLVALSDEEFIKYHCASFSGRTEIKVMAKDLVVRYGQVLHEVYWSKPVVSSEIHMDNVRGRLILSGTKIWNSLHERWNRIVNMSFCEESAWWFPNITSTEGERAVIPDRELGRATNDDDDDDDNDYMDFEEDQNQQLTSAEEATDALADSFSDPKMARVLTCIPQALPFQRRVKLFHSLLKADKRKVIQAFANRRSLMAMGGRQDDDGDMLWFDGSIREQIKIRRATLYEDSMEQLNDMGAKIKHQGTEALFLLCGTEMQRNVLSFFLNILFIMSSFYLYHSYFLELYKLQFKSHS